MNKLFIIYLYIFNDIKDQTSFKIYNFAFGFYTFYFFFFDFFTKILFYFKRFGECTKSSTNKHKAIFVRNIQKAAASEEKDFLFLFNEYQILVHFCIHSQYFQHYIDSIHLEALKFLYHCHQ